MAAGIVSRRSPFACICSKICMNLGSALSEPAKNPGTAAPGLFDVWIERFQINSSG
jgi:hypothetical protein